MNEEILTMAKTLCGATEAETAALALLCGAAERMWSGKLRSEATAQTCHDALVCAAALSAAAGLTCARAGGPADHFTAGDVSVTPRGAGDAATAADVLREQAARLMAPYVEAEDFRFQRVRG